LKTYITAYNTVQLAGWVTNHKSKEKKIELETAKNGRNYLRFILKVQATSKEYYYFSIVSWAPACNWLYENLKVNDFVLVLGTLQQETVELESATGKPRMREWVSVIARDVKKMPLPSKPKEIHWEKKDK